MNYGQLLSLVVVSLSYSISKAFSPNEMRFRNSRSASNSASSMLNPSFIPKMSISRRQLKNDEYLESDGGVFSTMIRANECALDETCTVEYAGIYLQELSQIQADGSISFRGSDVTISDIITMLREKINQGMTLENTDDEDISHVVFASIFAFSIATIVLNEAHNAETLSSAFTPQEYLWAIKGGYLDDMLIHLIRNGGL